MLRMKNNTVANREERINERLKKQTPRVTSPPMDNGFNNLKLNFTSGSTTNVHSSLHLNSPSKLNAAINTLKEGV